MKTAFPNDKPANPYIQKVIEELGSPSGSGKPVILEEFKQLCRRASPIVYEDQLIKYATPKSKEIQKKEHEDYTAVFLKEKRVAQGVKFLKEKETILERAERQYGIPRKDIVAILMWESGLGEFTGDYLVFNIFMAQLLFLEKAQKASIEQIMKEGGNNPLLDAAIQKREAKRFGSIRDIAIKGVVALLRQCKEKNVDPLTQKGSWGGAIGYVQFLPYRFYLAADGDKDGNIDLSSWPDAIFSVANYLKEFGQYGRTNAKRRKAIYSYNHSNTYVDGVIQYAEKIWGRYNNH
ncbi:lytic murein transglycosylase [bacterium]|nr:lytic murein transglycosylase [bacterium]